MPFRFLNPCNHMSLALNFFFSSSDSEGSSRTNFNEEHNDELLTVAEIDLLAAQEKKFQKECKKERKT